MAHEEILRLVPRAKNALLLVHGILGSPDHFRDLIPLVPEGWSLCVLLLDGHGGTVEDFSRTSMDRWKAQVSRRVEELLATHENLVIGAHSMGTLFAIQEAIDHPDRIRALFLLGSPMRVFVQPRSAGNSLKYCFGILDESDQSAVDMAKEVSVKLTPWLHRYIFWLPRFLELFAEIRRVRALLPRLNVPTQVFQSKQDELVSPRSCADFQGFAAIECVLLEDSGHFGYGQADLKFLQTRFLQTLRQWD